MGLLVSSWVEAATTTNNIPAATTMVLQVVPVDSWAWQARSSAVTTLRAAASMDRTKITATVEAVVHTAATTNNTAASNITALARTKAMVAAQVASSVTLQAVTSRTAVPVAMVILQEEAPVVPTLAMRHQPHTSLLVTPHKVMARTLVQRLEDTVPNPALTTHLVATHRMDNNPMALHSQEGMVVTSSQAHTVHLPNSMTPTARLISNSTAVTTQAATAVQVALADMVNLKGLTASLMVGTEHNSRLQDTEDNSNRLQGTAMVATTSTSSMVTEDEHPRWLSAEHRNLTWCLRWRRLDDCT